MTNYTALEKMLQDMTWRDISEYTHAPLVRKSYSVRNGKQIELRHEEKAWCLTKKNDHYALSYYVEKEGRWMGYTKEHPPHSFMPLPNPNYAEAVKVLVDTIFKAEDADGWGGCAEGLQKANDIAGGE